MHLRLFLLLTQNAPHHPARHDLRVALDERVGVEVHVILVKHRQDVLDDLFVRLPDDHLHPAHSGLGQHLEAGGGTRNAARGGSTAVGVGRDSRIIVSHDLRAIHRGEDLRDVRVDVHRSDGRPAGHTQPGTAQGPELPCLDVQRARTLVQQAREVTRIEHGERRHAHVDLEPVQARILKALRRNAPVGDGLAPETPRHVVEHAF